MIKQKVVTTLTEAYEEFMLFKKASSLSEKTRFDYDQVLGFFFKHNNLSGKEPVSIITEKFILQWIVKMEGMGIKVSSINHYIGDARVFLYWMMEKGYIRKFKIHLVKGQEPRMKFFSDEDIGIMLAKPSPKDSFTRYRTWVAICFVLATGARASTLINIRISDIDFLNSEITYRHLKNRSTAVIPLSKTLGKILKEYLHSWSREQEDGWLFCDIHENQCTVSALHQALDSYCSSRGIKSQGMHALRHAFARSYILNGGNALKLQKLLTHSTLEMTKRYVRLFGEDLKADYESFSLLDKQISIGRVKRTV